MFIIQLSAYHVCALSLLRKDVEMEGEREKGKIHPEGGEMKVSDLNGKEGMQRGRGVRGDKGTATSA